MFKNCFNLPMLLCFLRTSIWFNYPVLLKKFEKTVRDGLLKVCNVNFDNILSTQPVLLAEMGGLGVSSVLLLALSAFLFSAFGASDFLTTIFLETFEDFSFTKTFEKWLSWTNEQESPLNGRQKNWTQPVYVKTAQDLISRINDKRSKVFTAHQGIRVSMAERRPLQEPRPETWWSATSDLNWHTSWSQHLCCAYPPLW